MILSRVRFPGTRCYKVVRGEHTGPQMVRDQKKFGKHCTRGTQRPSRWYTNRTGFYVSSQKNIFAAVVFTCRVLLINS